MAEQTDDPRFYEALGRAIKVHRARLGLERRHLAERADVSYPYLSEIENGKKRPSAKALLAIAQALELRASELLEEAEGLTEGMQRTLSVSGEEHFSDRAPAEASIIPPAATPRRSWFKPRSPGARTETVRRARAAAGETSEPIATEPAPEDIRYSASGAEPRISRQTVESHLARVFDAMFEKDPRLLELMRLAATLPDEDLDRLIDLARRMVE